MSKALHALWLPASVSDGGNVLALWGESSRPDRRSHSPYDHPLALRTNAIDYVLANLRFFRPSGYRDKPNTLTLALPSDDRRPFPSPALAPKTASRTRRRSRREPPEPLLRPWRVEACFLPPALAFNFLLQLPARNGLVTFGPSLHFWEQAARLAAAALVRGQFVASADDKGRGHWQVVLVDAGLQTAAARLAGAMPPSARALAQPLPPPGELLQDFITSVGASYLAQAYSPGRSPFQNSPYDYTKRSTAPRPADAWWADLFPRKNYYFLNLTKTDPDARADFGERVRAWAWPVQNYLTSPYRVAFRLEPPAAVETIDPDRDDWHLSFHLQPKDKPDTLWAATEVWESAAPDPAMPDILWAGLSLAAGIYPPLAAAENETAPLGLWLNVEQALTFLNQYAAELSERGFGVLVPTWWKGRSRRVTARLALGQRAEGSGLLGLDALVDFNWQLAIGDRAVTPEEFLTLAQSKTSLVQVRGEWMQLNQDDMQTALKLVQRHQRSGGKLSLSEALALALAGPAEWEGLEVDEVSVDGWLQDMAGRLAEHRPLEPVPQPAGFHGQLRPYQLNGLAWLNFMRECGLGACLADDMGLGKTIMVLALLARDLDAGQLARPVLLVCPTTVVNNWVREAAKFAPDLRCYAHHGPRRFKRDDFARAAGEHHLVITSYALLPRDLDFLAPVEWGGVVLDEAHNIKNPSTKQAQAAREIQSGYRIALTGTPIENRLQDLWSIMHFLNPGFLGSAESFQRNFAGPIEREQDPRLAQRLRALTAPFILRRLKTDTAIIQDLPLKNEMKEFCGLTKEQAALYRAVVQESLRQIAAADGIQRRGIILATLTKLKQVCNHPRHLLGDQSALRHRSGKLNRLTEMLEQALAEDDRVLIFTQYAEMGALLQAHLSEMFGETLYLHGGTPARKRAELIDRFQSSPPLNGGPRLFVLSLKAGGAGINLTRANRVFHYDRWWNPAVENQATDRAFRIGQTQSVQVHKMICRGTLEERVDELITRKLALADQVVGSGESWLTELSTDELRDLLLLRREAIDE